MKNIDVYIVLTKPLKTIQQYMIVQSVHESYDGAEKAAKKFLLTYPFGYYEIRTLTLRK